jgi:hypothetical protein
MNPTEIYRGAIQRTFSDLYGVSPKSVAVAWADDGESITVRCAGKTFRNQTGSVANDFVSEDEDPVTVALTENERRQIQHGI